MKTWAEHKIVEYLLRHTWGYHEYGIKRRITLDEFMHGRKRHDGSRLDSGTGLGKKAVIDGIRAAIEQGFISEEVDGTDRARVKKYYSLVMLPPTPEELDQLEPSASEQGFGDRTPDVRSSNPRGAETEQQQFADRTAIRERHHRKTPQEQHHDGAVDELTEFGMSGGAAKTLAGAYDAAYIAEKLDLVRWLQQHQPKMVGKNPAGFLRRALEEDYQAPPGYQPPAERQAQEEAQARKQAELAEIVARQDAEREQQRAAERKRKDKALAVFRREHPAEQIPGTELTTETAWEMALQRLQESMTAANYTTWLSESILVSCDGSTAIVAAPSTYVVEWLAKRFRPLLRKELTQVLGFPVELDFLALPELASSRTAPPEVHRTINSAD
jgi:DnaA N-terminal domain